MTQRDVFQVDTVLTGIVSCTAQVRELAPKHLRETRRSTHITCATFSASGEVLATYNDEVRPSPPAQGVKYRSMAVCNPAKIQGYEDDS